jgi:predicted metal-dependent phosphoesterase TrpH
MILDLHTHSNASDGQLAPQELLQRAAEYGVDVIAITDHDNVDGSVAAAGHIPDGLTLIPGIEFSTVWRKIGIHVVGLNIDLAAPALLAGIASQQLAREERTRRIAERLDKLGLKNTYAGAKKMAGNATVGRPHFARFLVESGQIKDIPEAFRRYLGRGKPGDIHNVWAPLDDIISWIRQAGGTAVLAHPGRYKLTNLKLEELTRDFATAGGQAIEVISGKQDAGLTRRFGKLANRYELLASCGSDFHQIGQHWAELGSIGPLPVDARPVWEHW